MLLSLQNNNILLRFTLCILSFLFHPENLSFWHFDYILLDYCDMLFDNNQPTYLNKFYSLYINYIYLCINQFLINKIIISL